MPHNRRLAKRVGADLLEPVDRGLALAGGFEDYGGHIGAGGGLVAGYAVAHLVENGAQKRVVSASNIGGLPQRESRILPEPCKPGIHASYDQRKILRKDVVE